MAQNWAIVIGINQYHFLQPLRYAKRDAEAMQQFLANEAKFDRIFLFTDDSPLINGKPTEPFRANLLRVLRQIFAQPFMKDGDNFWFFFSGHGIPHNGQDYLMPQDGDPENIENTGISTNLITNYLRGCGADNAVMILDACRNSGKKSGEGIGKQTAAEARQTGVISLLSCSPDQYSYELEPIGQGAFTYCLLEGLSIRGRCATVERLNQYLESQVPVLVKQHLGHVRQTPRTIAEPIDRSHLILMPQYASLADLATLKVDAFKAETEDNFPLAERLWIRVLVASSGGDQDAIKALQRIAIKQHTGFFPTQPQSPLASSPVINSPAKAATLEALPATPVESEDDLSSEKGIDYGKLRDLLKARQWKEADKETYELILRAVGRKLGDYIREKELLNFPCTDLKTIDRLWVKYSQGRFGFSMQKKIYVECGAKLDGKYPGDKVWEEFGDRVGWRKDGDWLSYSDLDVSLSSPQGLFPGWLADGLGGGRRGGWFFSRTQACEL